MHIPDGILDLKTTALTTVITVPILGVTLARIKNSLDQRFIPLISALAAFVFVAQMINFPISAGTSGHLIGAFLLTVLFGPWLSILILTLVLLVQAFIFQDGGILALPANIFNMAICGSFASFLVIKIFSRKGSNIRSLKIKFSVIAGSILSLSTMAFAGAVEFWLSGLFDLKVIVTILVFSHMLVGIGEGLITIFILSFLEKVKPDMLYADRF